VPGYNFLGRTTPAYSSSSSSSPSAASCTSSRTICSLDSGASLRMRRRCSLSRASGELVAADMLVKATLVSNTNSHLAQTGFCLQAERPVPWIPGRITACNGPAVFPGPLVRASQGYFTQSKTILQRKCTLNASVCVFLSPTICSLDSGASRRMQRPCSPSRASGARQPKYPKRKHMNSVKCLRMYKPNDLFPGFRGESPHATALQSFQGLW